MTHHCSLFVAGLLTALLAPVVIAPLGTAVVAQATPGAGEAATAEPAPLARVTSTPRPDGSVIHIVRPGDTLGQLARDYGVSLDDLRALNAEAIGEGDLITVGQALVIVAPAATPTPRPSSTPSPAATPSAMATPPPGPTATRPSPTAAPAPAGRVAVCVLAYHDRNRNGAWDADVEELLPGAVFTLSAAGGVAWHYTTDGVLEPACSGDLQAGNYTLTLDPPAGYDLPGAPEEALRVSREITRAFGCRRNQELLIAPTAAAPPGGLANAPLGQKLALAGGLLGALGAVAAVALRLLLARDSPLV